MDSPILSVRNLSNFILKKVNFSIFKGEITVLKGKNGAGKTTLLKALAGLIPYDGVVEVLNDAKISFLFQNYPVFPHLSFMENIFFQNCEINFEEKIKALKFIEKFNFNKLIQRYPCHLSGGEKQIAGLLRTLIIKRDIIFLDEPFNHLSREIKKEFIYWINEVSKNYGTSFIIVNHENDEFFKGRLIEMSGGILCGAC